VREPVFKNKIDEAIYKLRKEQIKKWIVIG
jgi:hypothetical protein